MYRMWLLCLLTYSGVSFANNCENPRNSYDDIYCVNKVFHDADRELNQSYSTLRTYLNDQQKMLLKRSQLAWIRQRDSNCANEEQRTVFVHCNLEETTSRNAWLRERIRECKTVGCKTAHLD
jgi:uncharacterized protein YecT (DUF1311 family)